MRTRVEILNPGTNRHAIRVKHVAEPGTDPANLFDYTAQPGQRITMHVDCGLSLEISEVAKDARVEATKADLDQAATALA